MSVVKVFVCYELWVNVPVAIFFPMEGRSESKKIDESGTGQIFALAPIYTRPEYRKVILTGTRLLLL